MNRKPRQKYYKNVIKPNYFYKNSLVIYRSIPVNFGSFFNKKKCLTLK